VGEQNNEGITIGGEGSGVRGTSRAPVRKKGPAKKKSWKPQRYGAA